jgi:hypothetical protein
MRAGAHDVDVVLNSDPFAKSPFTWRAPAPSRSYWMRSIDIMNDEVSRADLRIAGLNNDLSELRPEYRKVRIRLYQPGQPLSYDPLEFDPANIRAMIEAGYSQAATFTTV